jgi:hypothetical protein
MPALNVVVLGAVDEDIGDLHSEMIRTKAALLYGDRVSVATHKLPLLLARMALKARLMPGAVENAGGIDEAIAEDIAQTLEERWSVSPLAGELGRRNMEVALNLLRGDNPNAIFALPDIIAEVGRNVADRPTRDPNAWVQLVGRVAVQNYYRGEKRDEATRAVRAIDDLIELSARCLIEVDVGPVHAIDHVELDDLEKAFDHAVEQALEILTDAARREHPLFTRGTRLSLRDVTERGGLGGADFTRANRVELAARLVASIPAFPDATVDELVDLRERVAPHLHRFRAAIADFEDELNADVIDEEFSAAVDDIRQRQVEPALEELRESLRETAASQALVRAVPTFATSTLALGAALAVGTYELAGVAAVAAGASTAAAREILERRKQENERKKQRLFLLFDAERMLAS